MMRGDKEVNVRDLGFMLCQNMLPRIIVRVTTENYPFASGVVKKHV